MSLSRVTSRFSRTLLTKSRNSVPLFARHGSKSFQTSPNYLLSSRKVNHMVMPSQVSSIYHSALRSSGTQWLGFSSSASAKPNEKETVAQSGNGKESKESTEAPNETEENTSESDLECELSKDDLVKIVEEKEQLLMEKQEELEKMKDKLYRTAADAQNQIDRMKRETAKSKMFAIESFAKSLLDVADNLGRASTAAKESFSKINATEDTAGAVKQLKTLLEGVEMTEKQLGEVFRKFGLEKYDPAGEEFDPNRHNAVFQIPDAKKPEGLVAAVLKAGYILHDRVIRPAEVGVTVAVVNEEAEK